MDKSSNSKPNSFSYAVVKNWRTTTIGIFLAFSSFVSFSSETFGGRD